MSKSKDMAQTIEEIRSTAAAITEIANWLSVQFSTSKAPDMPTETQQDSRPAITLEQVRAVLADKSRAGHTDEIRRILEKHGAAKLSQIDPGRYEAILKEAEELTDAT